MKRICVFTGTRAEYGLLRPLLFQLQKESFNVSLLISGSHLSPEFGYTVREIEKDGFDTSERVDILLSSDTPHSVCKAMGLGMIGFSDALLRLKPDMLVVLGDRYEALAAAQTAQILSIPVAHLCGGDLTQGATDDAFRHAITKLSYLHFPSTEIAKDIIVQLGESPDRVFNVGSLSIDNFKSLPLLDRDTLCNELGIRLSGSNLLVTYHPETLSPGESETHIKNLLDALDTLTDTTLIFTKANADAEGRIINKILEEYVQFRREKPVYLFASLGALRYLSVLRVVDGVIGNSSSGIIEVPSFKIGTINIGARQTGRVQADSIINCGSEKADIQNAIQTLYSPSFQTMLKTVTSPYGDGKAAEKIVDVFKKIKTPIDLKKSFFRG